MENHRKTTFWSRVKKSLPQWKQRRKAYHLESIPNTASPSHYSECGEYDNISRQARSTNRGTGAGNYVEKSVKKKFRLEQSARGSADSGLEDSGEVGSSRVSELSLGSPGQVLVAKDNLISDPACAHPGGDIQVETARGRTTSPPSPDIGYTSAEDNSASLQRSTSSDDSDGDKTAGKGPLGGTSETSASNYVNSDAIAASSDFVCEACHAAGACSCAVFADNPPSVGVKPAEETDELGDSEVPYMVVPRYRVSSAVLASLTHHRRSSSPQPGPSTELDEPQPGTSKDSLDETPSTTDSPSTSNPSAHPPPLPPRLPVRKWKSLYRGSTQDKPTPPARRRASHKIRRQTTEPTHMSLDEMGLEIGGDGHIVSTVYGNGREDREEEDDEEEEPPPLPPRSADLSLFPDTMSSYGLASSSGDEATTPPAGEYLALKPMDFVESMNRLKECGWYWGPLSYDDANTILRGKEDGSFLVRDSASSRHILVVVFRARDTTHHTRLHYHNGIFSFWEEPAEHQRRSASVVELMEATMEDCRTGSCQYFLHTLRPPAAAAHVAAPPPPPLALQLLYPVSRLCKVTSLKHNCRFMILKHVRRDHVDQLPLPSRLKAYLQAVQYLTEDAPETYATTGV